MAATVPPIKCQGIKTKLVPAIKAAIQFPLEGRWIEPFCGSCVVALNIQPQKALLADTNRHIVRFYQDIQNGLLTPTIAKEYLVDESERLQTRGEDYYYEVRSRFNENPTSLDLLFLNRSCFNGVMRFNRKGQFNVPFCRKPNRFAQAYITKIVNQIRVFSKEVKSKQWEFEASDFRTTLSKATEGDCVYVDPPYIGRHVDYFNSWSEADELELIKALKQLPCRFLLSTWHSNKFRHNQLIEEHWNDPEISIYTTEHFYHVGATEELRHSMTEAVITNFVLRSGQIARSPTRAQAQLPGI